MTGSLPRRGRIAAVSWRPLEATSRAGTGRFFGGGEAEMADLVESLDPGGAARAFRDHQSPDGFDVAVTGLRRAERSVGLGGAGRLDGVDGVGLAFTPAGLTVGSVDLDHRDPRGPQAGQAGPVGAGALHPDPDNGPKCQPRQQLVVACGGGGELGHTEQSADESSAAATFTSRWVSTPPVTGREVSTVVTAIPSISLVKGWHMPPIVRRRCDRPAQQDDPPHPTTMPHARSVDGSF